MTEPDERAIPGITQYHTTDYHHTTLRRVAMTNVSRYQREPDDMNWPRSAAERAVAREGRIMQQIIMEKARAAARAAELDSILAQGSRATIKTTQAAITADTDQITDPRSREVMEKIDQEIIEYHHQHQVGYYRLAGEAFAQQLSRDITPEKPPRADTVWQQVVLEITGG